MPKVSDKIKKSLKGKTTRKTVNKAPKAEKTDGNGGSSSFEQTFNEFPLNTVVSTQLRLHSATTLGDPAR